MPLTTAGRDLIAQLLINLGKDLQSSNAYIWVGSSTAAFLSSQTHLLSTVSVGATQEATYPTSTAANVITFRSVFSTTLANFDWNEWGAKNSSTTSTGDLLNRKQEALGTKANTQTWQITAALTIST